jgi:hypothetical protein
MATDNSTKKSTKSSPEICNICANNYTPILRKKIICKFCSKDTCSKCIEQYLMSRMEDAHCIHCRVKYTDSMLYDICTKTYLQQTYFRHRQEILMNRERANLPGLQTTALERRRRRDSYHQILEFKRTIHHLKNQKMDLRHEYNQLYVIYFDKLKHGTSTPADRVKLDEISAREHLINTEIRHLKDQIHHLRWNGNNTQDNEDSKDDEKKEDEKKKFIRRCMKPNCQGFLSTAWKCGLCNWYSCSKCFSVKGENHDSPHECKKEDLDTAALIRSDSKPCPSCGEFINKSVGCDMMFCVSCKTPFSWNSGKIITTGHIHNPHYFEWLNRTGGQVPRNPADVPCGGFPMAWELRQLPHLGEANRHSYQEFYRICTEIQDVSQRTYRSHLDEATTHDINIRFLLNDFDEKLWGRHLAMNEKKRKRDFEIQEIFGAFRMIAVELINRIQHYRTPVTNDIIDNACREEARPFLEDVLLQMKELIIMINDSFRKLSLSYHYTVPHINTEEYTKMNRRYNGRNYEGYEERTFRYRLISKNFSVEEGKKKKKTSKKKVEDEKEEVNEEENMEEKKEDTFEESESDEDNEEDENEIEEVNTVIETQLNPEIIAPNEFQDVQLQQALEESFKNSQLRQF